MSKYTTEVRFICEQQSGLSESRGYGDVGEIIEGARSKIFDFNYPIFDSNYKPTLETKILMHYYTREISEETYGLWKLRLRTRLNEIMPYYNKLYESELIEFNPLWDTDLSTERDITNENEHQDETVQDNVNKKTGNDKVEITGTDNRELGGTDVTNNKGNSLDTNGGQDVSSLGGRDVSSLGGTDVSTLGGEDVTTAGGQDVTSTESDDKTNTWDLYSDTPQGSIKGIEGAEDSPSLGDNGYLTNARHIIGDTDGSSSESTNTYGRSDTTEYGRTDTTEYGRTNTTDYGRSNTTEYGKTLENEFEREESVKYGRTDKNEYDKNVDTIYNNQDKFDGKSNTLDNEPRGDSTKASYIVISKQDMTLSLYDTNNLLICKFPVALGKNLGNKRGKGDMKTPEGEFTIQQIQPASDWGHDFGDGKGWIPNCYGNWFIRLKTPPHTGIGIHGTHDPASIGTRATEGCIRLNNVHLDSLKPMVKIGMKVTITSSDQDRAADAELSAN